MLDCMAGEFFDLLQVVQEHRNLGQIQMLRIAERPRAELAAELGISGQAVFEHFVALAEAGTYFRELMLGEQGASDLVARLFELHMKVNPGQIGDGFIVSDDFQHMRRFQVVVIGVAEFVA
ncbi:hypothetical protein D3C72_426780 [compost metagenome]